MYDCGSEQHGHADGIYFETGYPGRGDDLYESQLDSFTHSQSFEYREFFSVYIAIDRWCSTQFHQFCEDQNIETSISVLACRNLSPCGVYCSVSRMISNGI